jgi:hypothetical protein
LSAAEQYDEHAQRLGGGLDVVLEQADNLDDVMLPGAASKQ